ncbi:winged helix DNA-binding domain-containing protein [Egicoccus sp. AB-alg2]|uniref:winged helix DNA-binding domain-containing protein n=1 Tax=Egicoccus sp. AB-alg2 TaxID=3242693 RepID=UPI00359E1BBA
MHVTDAQRRARLVARHRLDGSAPDPVSAARAVVAVHASDPVTPYLAVRARLRAPATAVAALDAALYDARTLWRLHAVRRTLFVAALEDAALLEAAAGRDVAVKERRRVLGWLTTELGDATAAAAWLGRVEDAVCRALAGTGVDGGLRTTALTEAVPDLALPVTLGSGKYTTRSPVGSRVLFVLAMEGRIVRGRPAGSWRASQYAWALAEEWFPQPPPRVAHPVDARTGLLRRYLATHGPVTRTDLRWWSGWGVGRLEAALAALDVVEVDLDGGGRGIVLADDLDHPEPNLGSVALLPGLDPTPMGWKARDWFLGPHADRLFDRNGNAGPTVWVDGRVVGGWGVRRDGEVVHRLLEDVGAEATARVAVAAGELTDWLDGTSVTPRFRTPLERELTA